MVRWKTRNAAAVCDHWTIKPVSGLPHNTYTKCSVWWCQQSASYRYHQHAHYQWPTTQWPQPQWPQNRWLTIEYRWLTIEYPQSVALGFLECVAPLFGYVTVREDDITRQLSDPWAAAQRAVDLEGRSNWSIFAFVCRLGFQNQHSCIGTPYYWRRVPGRSNFIPGFCWLILWDFIFILGGNNYSVAAYWENCMQSKAGILAYLAGI